MTARFKYTEIKKAVNNLRVETCSAILSNLINTDWDIADIDYRSHIVELSEQYSLLVFSNWIATKFGFPAYNSNIDPDSQEAQLPLLSWASLAIEYPFNAYAIAPLKKSQLNRLYKLMDKNLEPDLAILGEIHQQSLACPLVIDHTGLKAKPDERKIRAGGEYYSPAWVIKRCYENVFNLESNHEDPAHCKIMDPACGSGNFLIGMLAWLKERGSNEKDIYRFAKDCLHGHDIDGRALWLCRLSVVLFLSSFFRAVKKQEGTESCRSLLTQLLSALNNHITLKDSLIENSFPQKRQFDLIERQFIPVERQFDLVERQFIPVERQFDLVVGNPPYISFGARNQPVISKSWQKYIKRSYPESAEYKIRLHSIFQEIAINMVRPGGRVALLLPDAFLNGSYYEKLRKFILNSCRIVSLMELPEDTISGATVGRWCLTHYKKNLGQNNSEPAIHLFRVQKTEETRFLIPSDIFVSKDKLRFQLLFSKNEVEIFRYVFDLPFLSNSISGHTGIRARNGQSSIIAKEALSATYKKGLVSGGQVNPYYTEWRGDWLDITPERLFSGGFDSDIIDNRKILVRQTADRFIASIDESGLYHLNNVHSFKAKNTTENTSLQLHFYCGLLNSSFYRYVYRLKSREHKRAMAQIDIEMVESMPLPPENSELEKLIACASEQLHRYKHAAKTSKNPFSSHQLERAIDTFVYEIFNLPESQKKIIEDTASITGTPLPSVAESRTIVGEGITTVNSSGIYRHHEIS